MEAPSAAQSPGAGALAPAGATGVARFAFRGEGGALFVLLLKNVLLTILTLGVYTPWARTERRKFLWSNLEVGGARLAYTGTGAELLRGYLTVAALYAVATLIGYSGRLISRSAELLSQLAVVASVSFLIPFAIYWSRRYLLSRTHLRGIRLGLGGSAGAYAREAILGGLLTVLTLGCYFPIIANRLHGMMVNNTYWGTERFKYDGRDRDAFRIYVPGLLLSVLTLGVYAFWLAAKIRRFRMEHTVFQGARGRLDLTGGTLFKLMVGTFLGTTLTLGLAFPWLTCWAARELASRARFEGPIDFNVVRQRERVGSAAADDLAGAMGVDLGV